jgi:pyridoxal phosphate enzyme (YggS family)
LPSDTAALRARLASVRDRIAIAAGRVGRDPASVRLIAISKTFSADAIRTAVDVGQVEFGENKVQEALPKIDAFLDRQLRWHLVGHLQSNKARKAAERFDAIHSIDSAVLLARVDEAAAAASRTIDVLLQVDLAGEATKHGALPEHIPALLEAGGTCRAARLVGLMTLPPAADDPESARPYFARLRNLRDRFASHPHGRTLSELSMGMSHDFEVAVEEGATMVRVGSAIFGARG